MYSDIGNLNAWTERTELLYRYPISPCICYEIHILHYQFHTEILYTNASLYIVGEGFDKKENEIFFKRECLLDNGTVLDCLNKAIEDCKERTLKNKESED